MTYVTVKSEVFEQVNYEINCVKTADLRSKMTNNCNMLAYSNSKNGEVRMKRLWIIALSNMAGSIQQSINSPFAWEGNPFCDITSMHAQGTNALSTAVAT